MAVQVCVNPEFFDSLKNGMPDLGLDSSLRAKRRTGKILRVHGPYDAKGQLIADGLVRLVDKAIIEYREAKSELLQFFPDGYLYRYHRAQDHFESFVQSLHRAINYLDRLRARGYPGPDGNPLVSRPRDIEVLRESTKASVRVFRDHLEHLDEDILDDKIGPSEDVGPKLGATTATIGDATLAYVDLARWCGQLHVIAGQLSYVLLTVENPKGSGSEQGVTIQRCRNGTHQKGVGPLPIENITGTRRRQRQISLRPRYPPEVPLRNPAHRRTHP